MLALGRADKMIRLVRCSSWRVQRAIDPCHEPGL